MDNHQALADLIEQCDESPLVRKILIRELEARNYTALASLIINLVQSSGLNVLSWDELEELTPVGLDSHRRQEDTGSGQPRSGGINSEWRHGLRADLLTQHDYDELWP